MDPSGIRIGVPAVTTRGMKEREIKIIAKWIKEVYENHKDKKVLKRIHKEVIAFCKKFPLYKNLK
jgi:glycine hydroxymethyltransferase